MSGDKDLVRNMQILTRTPLSVLDSAAKDALEPMRAKTAANARPLRQPGRAPKGGHLDEGVVVRKKGGTRYVREFWVGMTRRALRIAHLVEFGTAPHWQPRRRVMHPGARPKPFMRPAFEEHADGVPVSIGRKIWSAIAAAAARMK